MNENLLTKSKVTHTLRGGGLTEYDSESERRRTWLIRKAYKTDGLRVEDVQRLTGLHLDACHHSREVRPIRCR